MGKNQQPVERSINKKLHNTLSQDQDLLVVFLKDNFQTDPLLIHEKLMKGESS